LSSKGLSRFNTMYPNWGAFSFRPPGLFPATFADSLTILTWLFYKTFILNSRCWHCFTQPSLHVRAFRAESRAAPDSLARVRVFPTFPPLFSSLRVIKAASFRARLPALGDGLVDYLLTACSSVDGVSAPSFYFAHLKDHEVFSHPKVLALLSRSKPRSLFDALQPVFPSGSYFAPEVARFFWASPILESNFRMASPLVVPWSRFLVLLMSHKRMSPLPAASDSKRWTTGFLWSQLYFKKSQTGSSSCRFLQHRPVCERSTPDLSSQRYPSPGSFMTPETSRAPPPSYDPILRTNRRPVSRNLTKTMRSKLRSIVPMIATILP